MSVTAFLLNERCFEPRLWLSPEGLVDLKDIKAIIDLMKKNSISEFELERQDFKIRLKRGGNSVVSAEDAAVGAFLPMQTPMTIAAGTLTAPALVAAASNELEIKSPMIG